MQTKKDDLKDSDSLLRRLRGPVAVLGVCGLLVVAASQYGGDSSWLKPVAIGLLVAVGAVFIAKGPC